MNLKMSTVSSEICWLGEEKKAVWWKEYWLRRKTSKGFYKDPINNIKTIRLTGFMKDWKLNDHKHSNLEH